MWTTNRPAPGVSKQVPPPTQQRCRKAFVAAWTMHTHDSLRKGLAGRGPGPPAPALPQSCCTTVRGGRCTRRRLGQEGAPARAAHGPGRCAITLPRASVWQRRGAHVGRLWGRGAARAGPSIQKRLEQSQATVMGRALCVARRVTEGPRAVLGAGCGQDPAAVAAGSSKKSRKLRRLAAWVTRPCSAGGCWPPHAPPRPHPDTSFGSDTPGRVVTASYAALVLVRAQGPTH